MISAWVQRSRVYNNSSWFFIVGGAPVSHARAGASDRPSTDKADTPPAITIPMEGYAHIASSDPDIACAEASGLVPSAPYARRTPAYVVHESSTDARRMMWIIFKL